MSLHRNILIFLLLFITACGFTPVYKSVGNNSQIADELASIEIISQHDLSGQFFKTNLENLLNPKSRKMPKKYKMETTIRNSEIALAIQEDRTITRYKIVLNAQYKLTDLATGKEIGHGNIKREGGYDKVDSDYATYISKEDATKRTLRELAEDTKIRIMSAILSIQ